MSKELPFFAGIEPPFFPIVYVRGFAATMAEIEDTVASPYMGFNLGATKIRQDWESKIIRFVFESPIVRLMKDHKYTDTFDQGREREIGDEVSTRSIWIFRYYEQASEQLGDGTRREVMEIAADLRRFILKIRDTVCPDDGSPAAAANRAKFRVYLVAHSMGGLVARCYLQNLCVRGAGDAARNAELGLVPQPPATTSVPGTTHLVDKVYTYATPHNGIDMLGTNVPNLGWLDPFHVRNFNRDLIRNYLALPPKPAGVSDHPVSSLNGAFPPDRFFCLVGSNHRDYEAFYKLSRKAVSPMSDGLVTIANATVDDSPRAFTHRSHSGGFGIVNSEEGYQNLCRFLFGDVRVDVQLLADEITLPKAIEDKRKKFKEANPGEPYPLKAAYHIECSARVRGATYYLHERKVEHSSAIHKQYEEIVDHDNLVAKKPIYLFSGYLMKSAKTSNSKSNLLAFAVRVSIRVPMYEIEKRLWLDEHFEGGFVFDETVTFQIDPEADGTRLRFGLASKHGVGAVTKTLDTAPDTSAAREYSIELGFAEDAKNPPRPGFRGRLVLTAKPWNM